MTTTPPTPQTFEPIQEVESDEERTADSIEQELPTGNCPCCKRPFIVYTFEELIAYEREMRTTNANKIVLESWFLLFMAIIVLSVYITVDTYRSMCLVQYTKDI